MLVTLASAVGRTQVTNPRATAEAAMLTADRDFNQAAADRNMTRFLSFVADNAAFDSAEGRGPDAVRRAWAPFFEPGGPTLRWTPARAEALVGADVGYTIGTWERHAKDARGSDVVRRGQYLTVWRKQKDGAWRAEFDTGSTAAEQK
jgi:ketosteroid isomerase-like protein